MDGNYLRTLPRRLERCDAVLFLDYPRRLCLFRALRRILRWRGRTRPDMAEGCPERLDPAFIRWIWDFHRTQRPRVLELLDGWKGEAHIFRSPDCLHHIILLCQGRAPEGHGRVPNKLVQGSSMVLDGG